MSRLLVTWKKSTIGYRRDQRDTIRSLGLRRLHQVVEHPDTPVVQGMVRKVRHLVKVELKEDATPPKSSRVSESQVANPQETTERQPHTAESAGTDAALSPAKERTPRRRSTAAPKEESTKTDAALLPTKGKAPRRRSTSTPKEESAKTNAAPLSAKRRAPRRRSTAAAEGEDKK